MSRYGVLGLYFLAIGCGRGSSMSAVEVTPSQLHESQLPALVSISGRGLASKVSLSLDDDRRAQVTEPIVALGETEVAVIGHPQTDALQVWVEDLAPGSYDLRVATGGSETVIRDAFRVLGADATDVPTASTSREDQSQPLVASEASDSAPTSADTGPSSAPTSSEASLDSATTDSSASRGAETTGRECVSSARLFADDFERGNLEAWTAFDTTGSCQTSGVAANDAMSGDYAFEANVTCESSRDHENYGALQFNGDALRTSFSSSGSGVDAPHGIVIEFWARTAFDFSSDDGQWVAFLLLSGTCDWSDDVFSVGTGNATRFLAISHVAADATRTHSEAEVFPRDAWAQVTTYVNYHTGRFVVWQDGALVTEATFVRPVKTLCHVRIGAYVSADTQRARVLVDDPVVWKLNADLESLDAAPCMTPD